MRGFPQYFEWLGIFMGGGLGAICRHALSSLASRMTWMHLPHAGTLIVNMLGCLVMGVCMSAIPIGGLRNLVVVGFLGGFTTYATFAWLLSTLWSDQRYVLASVQLVAHLVGGIIFLVAGMALGHSISR